MSNSPAEVGRRAEPVAPIEQAARIYRRLAEAAPGTHLPEQARSLCNLALAQVMQGWEPQGGVRAPQILALVNVGRGPPRIGATDLPQRSAVIVTSSPPHRPVKT
jgi:hypothetical protein